MGSATWSVEFDEDVINVTDDDFEIVDSGDAMHSSGPTVTVNSASSYTVAVGGVTGDAGGVSLNLKSGTDVESVATGELASGVIGPTYTNLPLPTAGEWMLVLTALALAFAAAVMIRKRALKHS